MRTFSSHNSRFTDAMTGRTIEYAYRLENRFVIRTADGHEAVLEIVDGEIVMTRVDVSLLLPGLVSTSAAGAVR